MHVVGTAGHVDHGKSTLVYRLTGIDPDRLAEEKARGMTIDLGFAWLPLGDQREVSIVDVPGHERFVKNMLAGVGGIDIAMLVVAADEGVMPQTREHLAILDLLQVRRGLVVFTKRDLVEADWLALVEGETAQGLHATVLAGAPTVAVSALTGEGIDELKVHLRTLVDAIPARSLGAAARMPIDRVFTLAGHGTVVTGTLLDGTLRTGDDVELLPTGLHTRIRSLQTHRHKVDIALAGSRVAANITGLAVDQIQRGDVLCTPGWLQPATVIDVSLRLLSDGDRVLKPGDAVTLYAGAAEIPATVVPLSGTTLAPGSTSQAQLRLAHPTAVQRGDRFIIRRPSPASTIGGGVILDPQARRSRRHRATGLLELELEGDDLLAEVLQTRRLWTIDQLATRLQQPRAGVHASLATLVANGRAIPLQDGAAAPLQWRSLADAAQQVLAGFHAAQPLRAGMPKEELRERLGVPPALWSAVITLLANQGSLVDYGATVHLPSFEASPGVAGQARIEQIVQGLEAGGLAPPAIASITTPADAPLLAYMLERGLVVRLDESLVYPQHTYRTLVRHTVGALESGPVTVAALRDSLHISRRYALALLEHLDVQRVTRRAGDARTLLHRPSWMTEL